MTPPGVWIPAPLLPTIARLLDDGVVYRTRSNGGGHTAEVVALVDHFEDLSRAWLAQQREQPAPTSDVGCRVRPDAEVVAGSQELTSAQLAERLGTGERWARQLAKDYGVRFRKAGRSKLWDTQDVDRLMTTRGAA